MLAARNLVLRGGGGGGGGGAVLFARRLSSAAAPPLALEVRKVVTQIEATHLAAGKPVAGGPATKVVVSAVVKNPFANQGFIEDMQPLVELGAAAGKLVCATGQDLPSLSLSLPRFNLSVLGRVVKTMEEAIEPTSMTATGGRGGGGGACRRAGPELRQGGDGGRRRRPGAVRAMAPPPPRRHLCRAEPSPPGLLAV